MEVFSGVASGVAIYNQLESCIRGLRRLYKNFKFAEQEIGQLIDEASICQSLSEIFNDISRPVKGRIIELAIEKKLDKKLESQATSARKQIGHITTKLKPLMKGSASNRFDKLMAKIWWHYTREEMQALLATLGSVKLSLSLFTSLLALECSLNDSKRSSTTIQQHKALLVQIMSQFKDDKYEPHWMSNANWMVIVIQEIQKEPITEARTLVNRELFNSRDRIPTLGRTDPVILNRGECSESVSPRQGGYNP
ncbi:hypothetical protein N7491_007568 [Penicillium cf. griseofulvum]|uniref:Uncharacterized protein n=1 Tax=Penicillium cf. griseofulvum TaxID=2972120 RepID=A0A9W9IUZ5_9EURO|nr:hypothetical protein N7472_009402 [Penicillium cf. griseofulvum]KAJ5430552.1 hypothetical protein N7491_007568 [Penicillium cf. griseofulvum]KAJ5435679.1 hypothetical protein N7445_006564 [Penicillium cf. griseofulvum]